MDVNGIDEKELLKLLSDSDYLTKKYFHDRKFCMAYDKNTCSGGIIRSHIISEKYIRNIARDGHIYSTTGSSHHKTGLYEFKYKGIDRVCHINGFCKHHDNSLFESFEKKDFCGEYKQIYDITFRALCREYFQKICLFDIHVKIKNGYFKKIEKTNYSSSSYFNENLESLKNAVNDLKFLYEQLKKYKISGIKYLLLETSKLPISTTGVIFPILDANGNKIQNLNQKQLGFIYNAISLNDKSFILIATIINLHDNTHKAFLESINNLGNNEKINLLLTYFFFNNDNIIMSPEWYERLTPSFQKDLIDLMNIQIGKYSEPSDLSKLLNFTQTTQLSILNSSMII
jgi:hypothetical protein